MMKRFSNISVFVKQIESLLPNLCLNSLICKETISKSCLYPIALKSNQTIRSFHTTLSLSKMEDRRILISSTPKKDEGTSGEAAIGIDSLIHSREDMFPSENTPKTLFNNIPFSEVPIVNIRVSRNNTIITLTDGISGKLKAMRSCGIEGFKNTRKGTNVAAQATAISFTNQCLNKGVKTVRVRVRGLGPGRLSSIKGLQMGGLEIISITDSTPVSWNPPRPRKQRTL
uniref:28S ribosomal protein S11, mitochondrial n=1 Tax=Clastoptera arizonana TaxID=38151 RepID=A0A1B6CKB1_9HEMI